MKMERRGEDEQEGTSAKKEEEEVEKKKKWQKREGKKGETEKDGLNEILTDVKTKAESFSVCSVS